MLVSGKLAERWSKILVVRIVGELSLDGKVFLQDGFSQARLFIQAFLLWFSTISPPIAPPLFDGATPNVQKIHRIPNILTFCSQVLAIDLINRPASTQARTHKLKKIVPEPNSFFMDVKCPGCFAIT